MNKLFHHYQHLSRAAVTLLILLLTMTAQTAWAEDLDTWSKLKTAVEAGGTVTMTHDITRDASEAIVISNSLTVTLDLNGHTIDGVANSYPYTSIFDIFNGGNLTITDLSEGKNGKIFGPRSACTISVTNNSALTLEAGTLGKTASGVDVSGSSFTMTGGTINTDGGTGVCLLARTSSFTMTGGTITGNKYGVENSNACILTVSGPNKVTISGNTTADVNMGPSVKPIVIGGDLHPDTSIGVYSYMSDPVGKAFTSGLNEHGSEANFFTTNTDLRVIANDGEMYFGQLMATNDAGGGLGNWCSYYNSYQKSRVCKGVTAYKAKVNAEKKTVELTELFTDGGVIERDQGVLLKSAGDIVLMKISANADGDYTGNELKGVDQPTDIPANCYTLSRGADGTGALGFYLYESDDAINGGKLAANKAYLIYTGATSRGFIGFSEDEATGIEAADNVQLFNVQSESWYSIDGRRLSGQPTRKGIYVRNGKKMIIK